MSGTRVMVGILAAAILVGGFSAGRLIGQLAVDGRPAPDAPSTVGSPPADHVPDRDISGSDVRLLPRYPGSVRTRFERRDRAEKILTTVEYLAAAARKEVRSFYVDAFRRHGWQIVDLVFEGSTWTFTVERGRRQAAVEIQGDGAVVTVRLEVLRATGPPPSEPPPLLPPPPEDDDEGDDDADDDDDEGDDD